MDSIDYKIVCISHRRPENVQNVFESSGTKDVLFIVNDQKDVEDYKKNGAEQIEIGGSLVLNRNKALELCFKRNLICVQIDDDLKSITLNDFTGKRTGVSGFTVKQVVDELIEDFKKEPYAYAGFAPVANPFFVMKEKDYNKLITAPITFTKPNNVRYDNNLKLKEDYDYTLQHIQVNGGCVRYGKYLFDFHRYKNKGGAQAYRTNEQELASVNYLKEKWGNCILDNTKRKNEIFLAKNCKKILINKNIQGDLFC